MASKDEVNQDALAAEWGVALEKESAVPAAPSGPLATPGTEEAAAQWAAMADDGSNGFQSGKGGAERILNQDEIDSMLGFSLTDVTLNDNSGIRAIIDSAMVSYERLPMLEIIFDRLVRLMTTSRSTASPRCASATISIRSRCRRSWPYSRPRSGTITASPPSVPA